MILDVIHTFSIKFLNPLPYLPMINIMVSVLIFGSPMTKICRKHKQCFLIIKVSRKYLSIAISHLFIHRSCQNRYDCSFVPNYFMDKRQMHFNTMFILFIINIQHEKSLLFFELIDCFDVNFKRTKRSHVLISVCKTTSWKVFMMSWTKDKNSFNIVRSCNVLISPCSCRSTIVKTSMRSNKCLYDLRLLIFLCTIYVLSYFCVKVSSCIIDSLRLSVYHYPAWRHCRYCLSMIKYQRFILTLELKEG